MKSDNRKFPSADKKFRNNKTLRCICDATELLPKVKALFTEPFFDVAVIKDITFDEIAFTNYFKSKIRHLKKDGLYNLMKYEVIQDFQERKIIINVIPYIQWQHERGIQRKNNLSKGEYRSALFDMGDKNAYFK